VGRWAVPHGRLLAGLAGIEMSIHLSYVDELARGFFHLARLLRLPRDLEQHRLFLPLEMLERRDVTVDHLRAGRVDEAVQGLLWKESVRVRDALAQGRPLIPNLSLRHRFALKRFWVGALELLNDLERRDYDLWDDPPSLSLFRRVQVYLQTVLGRSVSR
jgi:phytoene synthase